MKSFMEARKRLRKKPTKKAELAETQVKAAMDELNKAKKILNEFEFNQLLTEQEDRLKSMIRMRRLFGARKKGNDGIIAQRKLVEEIRSVPQSIENASNRLFRAWEGLMGKKFPKAISEAKESIKFSSSARLEGLKITADILRSEAVGQMRFARIYFATLKTAKTIFEHGENNLKKGKDENKEDCLEEACQFYKKCLKDVQLSVDDARLKALFVYLGILITVIIGALAIWFQVWK